MKNSRRDFLKKGALAGFSALMIPEIAKAAVKENTSVHAPKINLKKDCVILFRPGLQKHRPVQNQPWPVPGRFHHGLRSRQE